MKVVPPSLFKEKLLPLVSDIILLAVSALCLYLYYTTVASENLADVGYVAYLAMFANALIGVTKLYNAEAFCDLRLLLDYAQIVLPHPCLTTALWNKYSVGPSEIALVHCFFGVAALLFFILMEYKRLDLTDLALIFSIVSSIAVGGLNMNLFACGAGVVVGAAYFTFKRGEECIVDASKSAYFNVAMAVYAALTMGQFDALPI